MGITAQHQLLHVEPGHDRLACSWVVREQESQRLARQHLAVDGLDLMRQRVDRARGDRDHRVEQIGEVDPAGLGGESEQVAVGVERPPPLRAFDDLERSLVSAEHEPLVNLGLVVAVGERHRRRAVPLDGDDGDGTRRVETGNPNAGDQVVERHDRVTEVCTDDHGILEPPSASSSVLAHQWSALARSAGMPLSVGQFKPKPRTRRRR